jgi:hypothetical protein
VLDLSVIEQGTKQPVADVETRGETPADVRITVSIRSADTAHDSDTEE